MAPSSSKKRKFGVESKSGSDPSKKSAKTSASHIEELSLLGETEDFPRGGGSLLNKRGKGVKLGAAKVDHLKTRKKGKKLNSGYAAADNGAGLLFGDGIFGKLPRFANKITLKNVSSGMKLWGMISEVNEKDIVVSLPGGLRGIVRACDAVDHFMDDSMGGDVGNGFLSKIFTEGQLVSCIVLQVDDDRKDTTKLKIWLSLRLSLLYKSIKLDSIQEGMVLNAYIRSMEDHGFILHFGLPSFTGFMPRHDLPDRRNAELNMGQILQGVVTSVDRAQKVVHLNSDPEVIAKLVTKEISGISSDTLSPGMMINARVISILENGILLSFLSYFTGTVDIFNLGNAFPSSNWKKDYFENMKVNARILFIDPSTRAIGLTLNPYLIGNKAPVCLVKIGDTFDQSKVVRADKAFGVLVELPTAPRKTPVFVSAADVSDKAVTNLDKSFREGSFVSIRLLGYRHLEGLAVGSLKASALEGSVFTHSDVKPGMVVKAKVAAVQSYGAIVQFASGVKALCPLRHMSEFERVKPPKKFQIGVELVFRVLGCRSKRISVTHKKTLVKSKLDILSSYADATDGLVTHGWITKIESHGCFVRFYNGVEGFAPRSELGLDPGSDIGSTYHVEQVVKCRVVKFASTSRRISLSFNITQPRTSPVERLKPGAIVSGVCEYLTSQAVVVGIDSTQMKGTINVEHLADNQGLAKLFMSVVKPGYHFDQLLVLDAEGKNVVLSAKSSLISSSPNLPSDISQVQQHSVIYGYICNIIESGCFVRFLGRLTGFSPKSKATDERRSDLSEVFYVGQSVRCNPEDVNTETGRITLSLKQSMCCSTDAALIHEYFEMEDKISKLQPLDAESSGFSWGDDFGICRIVEGKVHEIKDVGVVISFEKYNDVYGFISLYQSSEAILEVNSIIRAAVLDVSKIERLVDLSLKTDFLNAFAKQSRTPQTLDKKRKKKANADLEVNQTVNAVVEIVKENYLVLSLPNHQFTLGYASRSDYNTQKLPHKEFSCGQGVSATVVSLPAPSTGGRLLLSLSSIRDDMEISGLKRAKKNGGYDVRSIVKVEITEIKPLEVRVKFGSKHHGRIHITETAALNSDDSPFNTYKIGQTLSAIIISRLNGRLSNHWDLSVKPSLLAGSSGPDKLAEIHEDINYSYGQRVGGFVYKVDPEWVWLAVSRDMNAKVHILDSSCEPYELVKFQNQFSVGKVIHGYVITVNKEKKLLRLVLSKPAISSPECSQLNSICHLVEGSVIGGRISKILPGVGGLLIQIGPQHYGKVHFMELADSWVSNPLSSYQEGQLVKCKVLEVSRSAKGTVHFDLTLRSTFGASNVMESADHSYYLNTRDSTDVKDLHPNMAVKGYVKNISNKGCFIMLSRKIDALIRISNLSDLYVENPEEEFPIGKLVMGKVLSVEPLSKRVEVTLKTSTSVSSRSSNVDFFDQISVGSTVSGRIKRVETYGLFISIDDTDAVGLCHVSEISDYHIEDLEARYAVGQKVTTEVLKVDKNRQRISLGMKNSYLNNNEESSVSEEQNDYSFEDRKDSLAVAEPSVEADISIGCTENMNCGPDNSSCVHPADYESRALVLPLEVALNDIECLDSQDVSDQETLALSANSSEEKNMKKEKKRARLERELEIRAAEERLLESDAPRNADEFEKLTRSSPNSSFIWIKYMAHMLSLIEVEKARSIAERALQTINFREESEKLNIWVAYFNLENEYGNPPEEAVNKLFQRALQSCEPKKVHLALLGMYERTQQHKLAEGLFNKVTRKFRQSCKVWMRKIQYLLSQNSNEIQPVVNRALLNLPRHKHVKFISKAAILEFKSGVPDRGRTMFEGILREYPKRTDIWSMYLDQEIRLGDSDIIRALFERATSLSLRAKKIKFLFKKYLEYELSVGDEERAELVKKKALDYVESS